MKNKKTIVICAIVAAVVVIAGAIIGFAVSKSQKDEPQTTSASTTEQTDSSTAPQTTASTAADETTSSTAAKVAKHYAPNSIELNDNIYTISWSKDDELSLRLEDQSKDYDQAPTYKYYDIKINKYGELVESQEYEYDKAKKTATPTGDTIKEELKYNSKHQLVAYNLTSGSKEEGDLEIVKNTYTYNAEGYRIRRDKKSSLSNVSRGSYYTEYTYENGWLKKLYTPGFYEGLVDDKSKVDKVDLFYYDFNELKLPSKMYIGSPDEPESTVRKDSNPNMTSYEYEKVSQAQEKFYYNTLIYLITDYNTSFL